MASKWMNRDQKLLRRKKNKEQNKFFDTPPVKKKKTKRYPREKDFDDRLLDDDEYNY
jgi:hypothetical protein